MNKGIMGDFAGKSLSEVLLFLGDGRACWKPHVKPIWWLQTVAYGNPTHPDTKTIKAQLKPIIELPCSFWTRGGKD